MRLRFLLPCTMPVFCLLVAVGCCCCCWNIDLRYRCLLPLQRRLGIHGHYWHCRPLDNLQLIAARSVVIAEGRRATGPALALFGGVRLDNFRGAALVRAAASRSDSTANSNSGIVISSRRCTVVLVVEWWLPLERGRLAMHAAALSTDGSSLEVTPILSSVCDCAVCKRNR